MREIAIDVESYGVASAAVDLSIPWLIVKAVQNLADGGKSESEKGYRELAKFSSGYTIVNLMARYLKELNSIELS